MGHFVAAVFLAVSYLTGNREYAYQWRPAVCVPHDTGVD